MFTPLRTLSGQLLLMQLGIVLILMVVVGAAAYVQADSEFTRTETRRTSGIAERLATSPLIRSRLSQARDGFIAPSSLATFADATTAPYGVDATTIVDARGEVIASTQGLLVGRAPRGFPWPLSARGWSGRQEVDGRRMITSVAPVLSADARRIGDALGAVSVSVRVPSLTGRLAGASGYLLTFLGSALVVGLVGSWLVARRIKRQTLGLEPPEIAALAEYREAILSGIIEGVIALDVSHRITMINDAGRELLDLGPETVGLSVRELGLSSRLVDVLTGTGAGRDEVVLRRGRVLVMNRTQVTKENRPLGSVTTLRDRTELASLERELGAFRSTTELLRAQAHEFDNRLHTISGLIQIGDHDQVVAYVSALSEQRAALDFSVTRRLRDVPVAALVLAKASMAAERRVRLRVAEDTVLEPLLPADAADVATVVGNLIDNAVDAASGTSDPWVELCVKQDGREIEVTVCDSGPGVAPELETEVFTHGFTTKVATAGSRGIGLALTRRLCRQRRGDVQVAGSGSQTRFVARLQVEE